MARSSPVLHRLLILAVYLVLQTVALLLMAKNSHVQQTVLMRGIRGMQYGIWKKQQEMRSYFSLHHLNERLAEENTALRNKLAICEAMEEMRRQDPQGDNLASAHPDFFFLPVRIIHNTTHLTHNYIILNKGAQDGLKPDMGVVCHNGVVGIITQVQPHYSLVISLLHTDQRLSVRLKTAEGNSGTLTWPGLSSSKAEIADILTHVQAHPGDTVVTSGFSTIFPMGIPIGRIEKTAIKKGIYLDLTVSFFIRFEDLQYVNVAVPLYPEELNFLKRHE